MEAYLPVPRTGTGLVSRHPLLLMHYVATAPMDIPVVLLLSTRTRPRNWKVSFHPTLSCAVYLFRMSRSASLNHFAKTTFCLLIRRMYVESVVTCNFCFWRFYRASGPELSCTSTTSLYLWNTRSSG